MTTIFTLFLSTENYHQKLVALLAWHTAETRLPYDHDMAATIQWPIYQYFFV
jgi:hypothetical protein